MTEAAVLHFPLSAPPAPAVPLSSDEHPANRLLHHGAAVLSDAELLTLVTRSCIRNLSDLTQARAMLRDGLAGLVRHATNRTRHLRRRDAVRIAAAIELGRRATAVDPSGDRQCVDIDAFARTLARSYAHHVQERLGVAFLDSRNRLIGEREVFVGTLSSAVVSTRDVIRLALEQHAAGIIVYHNHPSGDPSASEDDHAFTSKLRAAAALVDVNLVDHIIVGGMRYLSFRQRGDL